MNSIIVGLIVFQALVFAVVVGIGLWAYKRNLGRQPKERSLVIRLGLGLFSLWVLANRA